MDWKLDWDRNEIVIVLTWVNALNLKQMILYNFVREYIYRKMG